MESSEAKFCSIQARDVCVVGAARTPIGSFNGSLSSLPATKLGSIAIEAALIRAGVQCDLVEEVFFGNVLNANLGQAPARQAALGAGIPSSVICTTINKVCASGMKALTLGAMNIQSGENNVVIVGGMESMSNTPYYLPKARQGYHLGDGEVIDGMMKDGLWDVYNNFEMGICAELCAEQYAISREEQDNYAFQSYQRAVAATFSGAFAWEMVPVEIAGSNGQGSVIINKDEGIDKLDADKFRRLQPAFKKNGSVTAGNASKISDGAAALVLVSGEKALELGLHVICRLAGFADAAQGACRHQSCLQPLPLWQFQRH